MLLFSWEGRGGGGEPLNPKLRPLDEGLGCMVPRRLRVHNGKVLFIGKRP